MMNNQSFKKGLERFFQSLLVIPKMVISPQSTRLFLLGYIKGTLGRITTQGSFSYAYQKNARTLRRV